MVISSCLFIIIIIISTHHSVTVVLSLWSKVHSNCLVFFFFFNLGTRAVVRRKMVTAAEPAHRDPPLQTSVVVQHLPPHWPETQQLAWEVTPRPRRWPSPGEDWPAAPSWGGQSPNRPGQQRRAAAKPSLSTCSHNTTPQCKEKDC